METNSRNKIYTSNQAPNKVPILFLVLEMRRERVTPIFVDAVNQHGRSCACSSCLKNSKGGVVNEVNMVKNQEAK